MLSLTNKQKEYWNNANCRWNVKSGATRSGKTFLDYYLIPKRIRAVSGKDGLYVILGNTKSTLQRNIIEPLQTIWGVDMVSDIKADNTAVMFGEKVHCIGADKISQVDRLRGASIKYCYGDEVVTWHEEVFNILKSRLDKEYSVFDGTCNPENPTHWFKKFIDNEDIDIYLQQYTLYDNPFLPEKVRKNLEFEYRNTIYFDRYILGQWVRAEGVIFRDFADNPKPYIVKQKDLPKFKYVGGAYDLGGNISDYGLLTLAQGVDGVIYVLKAQRQSPQGLKPQDVEDNCKKFIEYVEKKYNVRQETCLIDDSYYTTINALNDWRYIFGNACNVKGSMPLFERPLVLSKLMAQGRFKVVENECEDLIDTLQNLVYDERSEKAVPLDDGSLSLELYDCLFYALSDIYFYLFD